MSICSIVIIYFFFLSVNRKIIYAQVTNRGCRKIALKKQGTEVAENSRLGFLFLV